MHLRYFLIAATLISLPALTSSDCLASTAPQTDRFRFAPSTPLSGGLWMKISVDDSGVHEISHQRLRSMGFEEPERVSVVGRGGRQLPTNFISSDGTPLYSDRQQQIPVLHLDGKMYFYAQGPSGISFKPDPSNASGGVFSRDWKNIYSEHGYYFLTDTCDPMIMETVEAPEHLPDAIPEIKDGCSYVYHEKDLYQNYSGTGQVFYGEHFTPLSPVQEWEVDLPGAVPGALGSMECVFYTEFKLENSTVTFGIKDGGDNCVQTGEHDRLNLVPLPVNRKTMSIPGDRTTVFVEGRVPYDPTIANLDWWLLTYRRSIPDLIAPDGSRMNQDLIALSGIGRGEYYRMRLPGGGSSVVLDVTDNTSPRHLEVKRDGRDGVLGVSGESPLLAVFDPLMPQKQVRTRGTDFSPEAPQNLHAAAMDGADLIIICIPSMRDTAEKIADIHRSKQDMRVIVATTEECYNEFSGGVPDPMAYRALTRMAYDSSYGCRNLLLLGPLFGDLRGVINQKEPSEGIIAFQNPIMSITRGAMNVNDFYGMMADTLNHEVLHQADVEVGVGLLPIRYPAEAEIVVRKIEEYLDRTDFAHYLNVWTNTSCPGDRHQHDSQVLRLGTMLRDVTDGALLSHTVVIDAYGYREARKKLNSLLTDGMLRFNYYGHGSVVALTKKPEFFRSADVMALRNRILPFLGVAGCTLSVPDRGVRGIGESLVVSTPYGAVGAVVASRETWASENDAFFTVFNTKHFTDCDDGYFHTKPMTIGEIFAMSKTSSTRSNDMAYQLISDPAIVVPTINRPIKLRSAGEATIVPGQRLKVSGYIPDATGTAPDPYFKGEVVARVLKPAYTAMSADICTTGTSEDADTAHDLKVIYDDVQLVAGAGEVSEGHFEMDILIPSSASAFLGDEARLVVAAYDPDSRLGAATGASLPVSAGTGMPTVCDHDGQAPMIDRFEFDNTSCSIIISAIDNEGLDFSESPLDPAFRFTLDEKENPHGMSARAIPQDDSKSWSRLIPVGPLADGPHTAEITVRDAAGNVSRAALDFIYTSGAAYHLEVDGAADLRSGRQPCIFTPGQPPAQAEIIILDPEGNIIRRDEFGNDHYIWDLLDDDGRQVTPGLYRAYLLEMSARGNRGHSDTVEIPVV